MMKLPQFLFGSAAGRLVLPLAALAACLSPSSAAWAGTPAAGAGPAGVTAPVRQSSDQEFRSLFKQALKAHATKEMEKLVRSRKDDAVLTILNVCTAISNRPSAELEEEITGLRKAWKATHGTPFADRQYEFFSLLNPNFKRTRVDLIQAHEKTFPIFAKARDEKDGVTLAQCGNQFTAQAEGFEKVGDRYMASQSWYFAAQSIDEQYRGKDADLYAACAAWTKSVENREKAGLKDQIYLWAKERMDQLVAGGFDDPGKAEERAAEAAAAEAAAAITLTPAFEMVEDVSAVKRPQYNVDGIYQMWEAIALKGPGSTRTIQTMPDSPTIIREAAAKVSIDNDGDGEGDVQVPMTGNITPVRFSIGQGEAQREVAMLLTIGRQDDTYQGFTQNLGPDTNQMAIFFAPAGSMVTELAGTTLRIFDDNLDGIYGSLGQQVLTWGYVGCRDGSFQPDFDSIQIGKSKQAIPFSELIQVDGEWYRLKVEDNGKTLVASPAADVRTGTLKLKMKGPKVETLVLHGVGSLENVFVDVTANGSKGIEVPVGTYTLFSGRVAKGKRQQTMKALILPGSNMDNFVVKEGEVTQLDFGAPFGFVFEFDQDDESVTIKSNTIAVSGKAGETYQRLWNCVPVVDVLARKQGAKKGVELGSMRPSQSQEEVLDNGGYGSAWFPVGAALEKGKLKGQDVEVRLFQKKNKLFGKIESDWVE